MQQDLHLFGLDQIPTAPQGKSLELFVELEKIGPEQIGVEIRLTKSEPIPHRFIGQARFDIQ